MRILAVNTGSTSVKLSLIGESDETLLESALQAGDERERIAAVRRFAADAQPVDAVCHRVVHGGSELREPVVVDDGVRRKLEAAAVFAPLHLPPALRVLDALRAQIDAPTVACFDTAFHAGMPAAAAVYAIPRQWRDAGVRRYGFHGISCAWSLRQSAAQLGAPKEALQLLIAHLGGGCSVTAVRDGRGVDTTMGFTPLEGLVMATRSGSIDPAAVLFMLTACGLSVNDVDDALEHRSGLMALAGTADMRTVTQRATDGDDAASFALDVFIHHLRRGIGAMAMSLDRVNALVFTGGVGENAAVIRERAVVQGVLGTKPEVLVVHAREDLEMAAETRVLLGADVR